MLERPGYLNNRQIRGRAFSEPITIKKAGGVRNDYGEFTESFTDIQTLCATAPSSQYDRNREKMQGGVQLNDKRIFWTVEDLNPVIENESVGDLIIYKGETYRVESTQRWGTFSESVGDRQEPQ